MGPQRKCVIKKMMLVSSNTIPVNANKNDSSSVTDFPFQRHSYEYCPMLVVVFFFFFLLNIRQK